MNTTNVLSGLACIPPGCGMAERREGTATITVECPVPDYSASRLAISIEDAGFHMLDLWTATTERGLVRVTMRLCCEDPTPAVHSLERHGYEVTDVQARRYAEADEAEERLQALQAYLNV